MDLTFLIPILVIVLYMVSSIKILAEYERAVIFRLGRVLAQPKGPGVAFCSRRSTAWLGSHYVQKLWRYHRRMWSRAITLP